MKGKGWVCSACLEVNNKEEHQFCINCGAKAGDPFYHKTKKGLKK